MALNSDFLPYIIHLKNIEWQLNNTPLVIKQNNHTKRIINVSIMI